MSRLLIRGSVHPDVHTLHQNLKELGYTDIDDPANTYGASTEAAVMQFQTDNELDADGAYGPETQQAMEAALAAAEEGDDGEEGEEGEDAEEPA